MVGFVGRVRRQPPPGKTRVRCSKTALPPNFHLHTEGAGCWQSASVLHCPAALGLRGPTEIVPSLVVLVLLANRACAIADSRVCRPGQASAATRQNAGAMFKTALPPISIFIPKAQAVGKARASYIARRRLLARAYRDCAIPGSAGFVGQQRLCYCLIVWVL
jgi:hypothetical protein